MYNVNFLMIESEFLETIFSLFFLEMEIGLFVYEEIVSIEREGKVAK